MAEENNIGLMDHFMKVIILKINLNTYINKENLAQNDNKNSKLIKNKYK